jgi:hypothetical protein
VTHFLGVFAGDALGELLLKDRLGKSARERNAKDLADRTGHIGHCVVLAA